MTSSGDDRVTRKRETKRWPVQDAKARFSGLLLRSSERRVYLLDTNAENRR